MKRFILASASPRRAALLRMLGLDFDIVPSRVSERLDGPLPPEAHVLEIARRKARAVARSHPGTLILGADTIVELDGQILEKPADSEDAVRMLTRLSGKTHRVFTGVALVHGQTGRTLSDVATTEVAIRPLAPAEIRRYVDTQDPLDKAGAYAAQGRAAVFIDSVSGCFYNVVGLPLTLFWRLLEQALGSSPWSLIPEGKPTSDLISPGEDSPR